MSEYIKSADIKVVHLEHTSKCNLLCPQCARVWKGEVTPSLPMADLTLKDYKKLFTPEFSEHIDRVYWCGSYGDGIASGTWMECAFWLRYSGVKSMQLYTNGSARKPDWWKKLALIFNREKDFVYFSIDGLADTNHLYRVNSNFDVIMKNAEAFINAGGNARWDYLVFDHNQHQVEEAKQLARDMGFKAMVVKNTSRFISNENFKNSRSDTIEKVYDRKTGSKKHEVSDDKNRNVSKFDYVIEKYGNWSNYVDATPIRCKTKAERSIYVDFEFNLWPCCWTGAPVYFKSTDNIQAAQLKELKSRYEDNFNSLRKHSLDEILAHEWFSNQLNDSWLNTQKHGNPKLQTCGRTCGTDYEFSSGLGTANAHRYDLT